MRASCKLASGLLILVPLVLPLAAQEAQKKRVQINVIQVCTPAEADVAQMREALGRIPGKPRFTADFEISRGRSSVDAGVARWVRVRREFSADSPFTTAQYTMSVNMDDGGITETLALRLREAKDVVQVAIESSVTAGDPAAVLASDTPANHISVERYGKAPIAVKRCPQADQKSSEAIFQSASSLLASYRAALGVRSFVPGDLARVGVAQKKQPQTAPGKSQKPK
ncbi:MAG TPA: hypothetical protein VGQ94_00585 [Terriglobales bacterium]|nr:hypothetical protein [Terriglobales bacterium]